ncbi:methylamine utilization protein MauG [Aestuariirhabdus sp. Z084]|uniref:cytochrome-c peroxidase n=1 Tax=Aestuariirhabdus haliotis TaxID=2918751 RepID=UPI00201B38D5|nr:cytochrome c peroxidase [Aestuariirhabdus haliotis]MCL6415162.1 methylamine utilization protein MauG [Aestuariirhabdus haliotis]MCL6420037.1 methylamine utilization protein MauG [Aestuariirhabdus haliotis]
MQLLSIGSSRLSILCVGLFFAVSAPTLAADTSPLSIQQLGERLYFDTNLSLNRTQSCASCHSPATGFADPQDNGVDGAVSLGDDGKSLGDRNAPTASYAAHTPLFGQTAEGVYRGGQFLDGREADLKGQAGGPPLNPIEMGMPNKQAVVERLQENPLYVESFKTLFGDQVFASADQAYASMTESIAAFEKTDFFSPFDSKYDRYLRGEYQPNQQEELGMTLFFSQQFTNCNQCHQLKKRAMAEGETFSNYEYHNIGVPTNVALREVNGVALDHQDLGLFQHPEVNDPAQKGRFKVPTLRNVAVTGPYMHNGIFQDLRTVVLFYNKYNSNSARRQINPETSAGWAAPEVEQNLSLKELESGPALDDRRIDALVAFMEMLTDQRYEALLNQ